MLVLLYVCVYVCMYVYAGAAIYMYVFMYILALLAVRGKGLEAETDGRSRCTHCAQ
jgi:hypothetical protein